MNDTIYLIANTLDTSAFFCGIAVTTIMGVRTKLKGVARYKYILRYATIFLSAMGLCNTFMNVYRYKTLANEQGGAEYGFYPVMAGIICVLLFGVIIGVLWLIYAIWNGIEKKKKR